MTHDDLQKHLKYLAIDAKMSADGLDDHVKAAIAVGLDEFWNVHPWSWAATEYELDVSSGAESYELPDNIRAVGIVREKDSTYGSRIDYASKDRFDGECYNLTNVATGYPVMWTAYYDAGKLMFQVYPISSGSTLYLQIYKRTGAIVENIPNGFISGLKIACEQQLYPAGTKAYEAAEKLYRLKVMELKARDKPFAGHIVSGFVAHKYTSTSETRPW